MTQQTAVEWLIIQVNSDCLNSAFIRPELVEQAKQMEKEQILKAYEQGAKDGREEIFNDDIVHNAETYYKKLTNDTI